MSTETQQTCPHCNAKLDILPIEIKQEVNCQDCGRIFTIPQKKLSSETPEPKSHSKEPTPLSYELMLVTTVACILVTTFDTIIFNSIIPIIVFLILSFLLPLILFAHTKGKIISSEFINHRMNNTLERIQIFPYELIEIPCCYILIMLRLLNSPYREPFGIILLIFSLFLSSVAAKAYRKSMIVRSKPGIFVLYSKIRYIFDKDYRQKEKQKLSEREKISQELFKDASKRRMLIQRMALQKEFQDDKIQREFERKQSQWKTEVDSRFLLWIEEESKRLKNI
ncbi:MAG: hypothetical protein U9O87_07500 [Verrucomicrobiota bacterium]|nr:hypothetical protein [Verrucomicrobiota bacterium]